jgi:hypothetical protein
LSNEPVNEMEKKNYALLIVVLLFIGCATILAAYFTVDEATNFYIIEKNHRQAIGSLTKIIHGYSEDSTRTYEITYKVDGKLYSTLTSLYWLPEKRKVGEPFEIIYALDNPKRASVHVFSEYYLPSLLATCCLIIFGSLFFIVIKVKDWILTKKFGDD